jgi:energy-coupling factor transporter ATP-binding protein EcfA2
VNDKHHIVEVRFRRFKAMKHFDLRLRHFNILVGPNNAGKSTIIAAFRILEAGLRRANSRKAELLTGPTGTQYGYNVELNDISVAAENIFHNYKDDEPAHVEFVLSNGNRLLLYFPSPEACHLFAITQGRPPNTPSWFSREFNCSIGFVPILGPVDHDERLYEKETARRALFNYGAARNFRNIWYHYPDKFETFRTVIQQTWPGMDVSPPKVDYQLGATKPFLTMFCPEDRIPREIFWSGFGFQVWCQLVTHIVQASSKTLFLIDEPDIYLHSDLQRQLISMLRDLGPDILIATHSTEMISEAEPDDIVLIDKRKISARRIKNPTQLSEVFGLLGSNLNPTLTQLAKTRRVLFVEGNDFFILGRFAAKLGFRDVASRRNFAVVPGEGFNPDRIRSLLSGMEQTLARSIHQVSVHQ